jgi:hypothetical protein
MSEVHTLGGAYLLSSSKKIPSVTLSSTASEYYSNSNAATEMKFESSMLLDDIFLHDDEKILTGWLYNDNHGSLYLSKNQHVSMRMKHINIHAHYVRELQDKEIVKILFKKSENLVPDMLNKNLPEEDHLRHAESLLLGSMICWKEDVGEDGPWHLSFIQQNLRSKKTETGGGTQVSYMTRWSSTVSVSDENHLEKCSQDARKWITVMSKKKTSKRRKL